MMQGYMGLESLLELFVTLPLIPTLCSVTPYPLTSRFSAKLLEVRGRIRSNELPNSLYRTIRLTTPSAFAGVSRPIVGQRAGRVSLRGVGLPRRFRTQRTLV